MSETEKRLTQLIEDLTWKDPMARWRAAKKLCHARLGERAAEAVSGLAKVLTDECAPTRLRRQAALTLGRIGPAAAEAIPALTRALTTDRNPDVRWWSACALGRVGRKAADAIPALNRALHDPSKGVRKSAMTTLLRIADLDSARRPAPETDQPPAG